MNDAQDNLAQIMPDLIKQHLGRFKTILISKVVLVGNNTIDVQPTIQQTFNGKNYKLPIFKKVPLITLQGGDSYIHLPVAIDDYALLFINENCFDDWYNGNDDAPPLNARKNDYSDAFAIVGINNLSGAKTIPDTTIIIGDVNMTGNLTITGNLNVIGGITATMDIVGGGISLINHTHTGVHGETSGAN